jgi:hypothetical protein
MATAEQLGVEQRLLISVVEARDEETTDGKSQHSTGSGLRRELPGKTPQYWMDCGFYLNRCSDRWWIILRL